MSLHKNSNRFDLSVVRDNASVNELGLRVDFKMRLRDRGGFLNQAKLLQCPCFFVIILI